MSPLDELDASQGVHSWKCPGCGWVFDDEFAECVPPCPNCEPDEEE